MKKIALFLGLVMMIVACQKPMDKKAELVQLQKEHDLLTEKISKLQQEIAASDTSKGANFKVTDVAVSPVVMQAFNHYIEIQGRVDGDENVSVSPKMAGVITKILVNEGDKVKAGQVLAELDAEITRKGLAELKESLVFATTVFNKQKNLWDQKIGSEIQFLTAKNNKESLENKVKTIEEQLNMMRITAPISGTVEEIPVKVGQAVAPGLTTFRVIDFSKIKIVADLAEAYGSKVKNGDNVLIFFPDYNKDVITKLSFVSKFINPTNRTFQVEARLSSPDAGFKANMVAVVKINDYNAASAIVIPVNALQKDKEGSFVYVAEENGSTKIAKKRQISTGQIYNGLAEILTGLKTGDKVITLGNTDINDGQYINY